MIYEILRSLGQVQIYRTSLINMIPPDAFLEVNQVYGMLFLASTDIMVRSVSRKHVIY